jgi:ionotropic glutamate receptor
MKETGLLEKWMKTFNPEATECLLKENFKKSGNSRISLQNLTSAFILLIFGFCVSFLVFLVELMIRLFGCVSYCNIFHRFYGAPIIKI